MPRLPSVVTKSGAVSDILRSLESKGVDKHTAYSFVEERGRLIHINCLPVPGTVPRSDCAGATTTIIRFSVFERPDPLVLQQPL